MYGKYGELIKNYEWSFNRETGDIDISFEFVFPDCIAEEDREEFTEFFKQKTVKRLNEYFKDKFDKDFEIDMNGEQSDKPLGRLPIEEKKL